MTDFFEQLKSYTLRLIKQNCQGACPKVIIGFSGGPDSIFLLLILHALQQEKALTVIAAHLDHGWRSESTTDVEFCANVCQKLGIDFVTEHASQLNMTIKFNGSQEEIGRLMRRFFLKQVYQKKQADLIALAHHLQDQQETFFIRLMRGTTLSGLRCMDEFDSTSRYMRPLLHSSKKEILEYLLANNIGYLTDSTNMSNKYLRNRIRKNILPALKQCDQRFDKKFQNMIEQIKQEDNFLQSLTQQSFQVIFELNAQKKLYGNLEKFRQLHTVLQHRLILFWLIYEKIKFTPSSGLVNEITRFLNRLTGGTHQISCSTKISKKQKLFWLD
jgi:tRNA(Ile)-lysidine synthase